jgi:hypothetical protein
MGEKVAYGDGVKLSNNVQDGQIKDPISLDNINKGAAGESLILNGYAFNATTIYNLFKNIVDDDLNGMNMGLLDFEEFMVEVRDNGIYDALRFMETDSPKFKEDLKKIYLSYGGGENLEDHSYNTRHGVAREIIKPVEYEMKSEVGSIKKKRKSRSKKKTKRKKKRKSKQRRKSKMR